MKQLKKHAIGYNTVSSVNGVISARGVKSYPNNLQVFGYTHNIGEGEKSPDNPYILQSLDSGSINVDGVEYEHSIALSNGDTTIKVPVPIVLNSVEGVSDYIFKDSDRVWKLNQANIKYKVTGNEHVSLQSINGYGISNFLYTIPDISLANPRLAICNLFKKQSSLIANTDTEGFLDSTNYGFFIRIYTERASTVEEFKIFLNDKKEKGTPLTFVYQLKNSIEHTLSDYAQQLLNSFALQNQNEIWVEGYPDLKISGYIQK